MNGRLFGYARVSTYDQDLSLQLDALTKHGVPTAHIYRDKMSGAKCDRPGLAKCLALLQKGDILVVWRLDRLGRSMRHLVTLVEDLRIRGSGRQRVGPVGGSLIVPPAWTDSHGAGCQIVRPVWYVELDVARVEACEERAHVHRQFRHLFRIAIGHLGDRSGPLGPIGDGEHAPIFEAVVGKITVENLLVDDRRGTGSARDHEFLFVPQVALIGNRVGVHRQVRARDDLER